MARFGRTLVTYTLYYSPGACSISPHTALREAGLGFELVRVDLGKKTYAPDGASYLEVNPKGYVPALRLPDRRVITENLVMIQYIADQVPGKHLAPEPTTFERLRFAELLVFISTELHKGLAPFYAKAANDEYKAAVTERLVKRFAYLSEQLNGMTWLSGESFSVADGYAFYCLRGWKMAAKQPFATPELAAYYERLLARPSIRAVLAAEGIEG
jgi:glutathione S-transferase